MDAPHELPATGAPVFKVDQGPRSAGSASAVVIAWGGIRPDRPDTTLLAPCI